MEETVKPYRKVAIVGTAETKMQAPYNDSSFEIWGVNNLYPHIPRATRWFEIHDISFDGKNYLRRGSADFRGQNVSDYLINMGQWTAKQNCPVYMQQKWGNLIPTATEYPLKEILEYFPNKYFTNTVSYMIALAIMEDFDEIQLFGIDMAVDTEYNHQRPSVEYFLGFFDGVRKAKGKSNVVYIPPQSDLLKTRFLYGFEENQQTAWEKKIKQINASMTNKMMVAEQEMRVKEAMVNQYKGALQCVKELDKIWK